MLFVDTYFTPWKGLRFREVLSFYTARETMLGDMVTSYSPFFKRV
jgi:hypothetical protein